MNECMVKEQYLKDRRVQYGPNRRLILPAPDGRPIPLDLGVPMVKTIEEMTKAAMEEPPQQASSNFVEIDANNLAKMMEYMHQLEQQVQNGGDEPEEIEQEPERDWKAYAMQLQREKSEQFVNRKTRAKGQGFD